MGQAGRQCPLQDRSHHTSSIFAGSHELRHVQAPQMLCRLIVAADLTQHKHQEPHEAHQHGEVAGHLLASNDQAEGPSPLSEDQARHYVLCGRVHL